MAACLYDADARVGDQVHIIQLYAQNHWYEIQERLGSDAPNSWHYLTVRAILSNMGKNGANASSGSKVRQDKAEEKRKTLAILAKSGEPFWLRVKKGDIAANKGDAMHRTFQGKLKCNFPTIQVCHGQYESVDNLHYLQCPFGNNILVDLVIRGLYVEYSLKGKGYNVKVPYGMTTASTKNGNALLAWFEKKC